jgi:hypothetical protein
MKEILKGVKGVQLEFSAHYGVVRYIKIRGFCPRVFECTVS